MKDPERQLPFLVKALLVTIAALPFYYAIGGVSPRVQALATLLFAYVAAKLLSRDLIHFPGWFYRLVVRLQDGKLQGKLYVFDEVRIHLFLVDDEAWIAADGVRTLLRPNEQELLMLGKGYGKIPGTNVVGFRDTALLQLLAKRERTVGGREFSRFDKWLRDDAIPNLKRFPSSSL